MEEPGYVTVLCHGERLVCVRTEKVGIHAPHLRSVIGSCSLLSITELSLGPSSAGVRGRAAPDPAEAGRGPANSDQG